MTTPRKKGKRNRLVVGAIFLLLCVSGALVYGVVSTKRAYEQYSVASSAYVTAAHKPAAEENPVRIEVARILNELLLRQMTPVERLDLAQKGLLHLDDIEKQIDAIKTEGDLATPLLEKLDRASRGIGALWNRGTLREIVALAQKQHQIISDIRGLSYRADYYTAEVFERVIDDGGQLTPEHMQHLNDILPQLEAQYDQRSALYDVLEQTDIQITNLAIEAGYEEVQ